MFPKPKHKRRIPKRGKRGEFGKEVRQAIYERDNGLCQICNIQGSEIHHVRFKSQSGRGVYSNGILLCTLCHIKVHRDYDLAESLRQRMIERYGNDYYKDEYDKE